MPQPLVGIVQPPPLPLVATLGDSRIAQGFTSGSGFTNTRPHGAANWLEVLMNGRVRLPWAYNQAVSGAIFSDVLRAQLPLVLALNPKPTHAVILAGTNDVANGVPQATIKQQVAALWNELRGYGVIPLHLVDLPRTVASWTATDLLLQQDFNNWLRTYGSQYGATIIDPTAGIADPNNSNGDPLTNYAQSDGIHPTSLSAYQCGLALQTYFNQFPIPYHLRPVSRGDSFDATSNPRGNNVPNGGLFSGTGGSNSGAGASGTVADSWLNRTISGTLTAVASLVSRADTGGVGWWQQVVVSAVTGASVYRLQTNSNITTGLNIGDTFVAEVDVTVASANNMKYLQLNVFDTGGSFVGGCGFKDPGIASMYLPTAWSGRIVTPPFTIATTAGITFRLEAGFDTGTGATIQAGGASLRKVLPQ